MLSATLSSDGLQHAGDAILATTLHDADAALAKITTELVEALRARGWDGDDVLADTLERDPATSSSELTPVGVDLADLADALCESAGSEGFLDLEDGQVWTETIIEASRDAGLLDVDFDSPIRWLPIVGQGSAEPYRTMQRFIATIDDHDTVADSPTPSTARARSAASTTSCSAIPTCSPAGTASTTTPDSAKPADGSPTTATKPNRPAPPKTRPTCSQ